ncbi:AI-2E family transporter [Parvularcula sp. LCG005]|uniref:AI-2E family transporter n=1 Tax=Parvularcula sp. LCG005 TaxID=3078805 RepID=UPI002943DBD1|nr:AI-2E family transporter [Parvularcula sp. LCG005]WOI52923.1 AI-2E family transporter [Parvularcula sp. LCG005]
MAAVPPVRNTLQEAFFAAALAVLVFYILWVAQGVLVPLVTAIFLAFLIMSVKGAIERIPVIGRRLPNPLRYILSFGVIALTVVVLALIVRDNIGAVLDKAPEYQQRFKDLAATMVERAEGLPLIPEDALEAAASIIEGFGSGIMADETALAPEAANAADELRRAAFSFARGAVASITGSVGSLIGALVTTFLYTAFLLIEQGRFIKKLNLIWLSDNKAQHHQAEHVLNDIGRLVGKYISIKTFIALIVASISFVIMTWRQTDFAGFWALLIFAFGFVPIVGAILAIALPTILTLVQPDHGGFVSALITLILLTGAEQTVSSFIEPRLLGRSLNLSPLIILLSLATWGTLWGFPGMLLCVPMTVAALIILSQFEATRPIAIMLSDNGKIGPLERGHTDADERAPVAPVI